MTHDSRRNGCHTSNTDHFLYLMQSQLMAVSPLMKWSNCSKRTITEFIEYVHVTSKTPAMLTCIFCLT